MRHRPLPALLAVAVTVVTTSVWSDVAERAKPARPPQSVIAYPGVVTHTQPDGTQIEVRKFGDEHYNWAETPDGYTIGLNRQTGFLEYLKLDKNGQFALTGAVVGKVDPATLGIPKKLRENKAFAKQRQQAELQVLKEEFRARYGPIIRQAVADGMAREAYPSSGTIPVLVFLVNFDDTTTVVTKWGFEKVFNGPSVDPTTTRSVWQYYDEVSYHNADVQATIVGWYTLANGRAAYGNPDTNAVFALAEAIDQLYQSDPAFPWNQFDADGDMIIEPVILIHSGEGEELTMDPNDIWSHQWDFTGATGAPYPVDMSSTSPGALGYVVNEYSTDPELMFGSTVTIGVIVHEMGHSWGLPDLYDYGYDSAGVGDWALMASGSWSGIDRPGDTPPHWTAWCKEYVGWLDLTIANGFVRLTPLIGAQLPAVEFAPVAYRVNMGPDPTTGPEYLLIENRQWLGYDVALPNYGMLAYHVDMTRWNLPFQRFNDDQDRYGCGLIQADGNKDLELNNNQGDEGDPFPGFTSNRSLGPWSLHDQNFHNPDTNSYNYNDTNIWVVNISDPFPTMTVDIRFFANLHFSTTHPAELTLPVFETITFRDGSQRPAYAPGSPILYDFEVFNMDDNWPFAVLCEDALSFWVEFWGSRAGGLTFDYYLGTSYLVDPGIAGNGFTVVDGSTGLYSIPDGAYVPTITLDRPDTVEESVEFDNRRTVAGPSILVLRGQTDTNLVLDNFSFLPQWPRAGDPVQLGGQVMNNGTAPSGPFWIEFWGSFDQPGKFYPSLDFYLCDSIGVSDLAPGASLDLSGYSRTLYGVPPHDMLQTFSVGCYVDRTDLVNETNETDNYEFVGPQLFSTLSRTLPADLVAATEAITAPPAHASRVPLDVRRQQTELPNLGVLRSTTTLSGQAPPLYLQVEAVVHNYGLTTATASWTHVYVSRDGLLSPDDYLWIAGLRCPELSPGTNYSFVVPTGPPELPLGAYRMLVQCDVLDEVAESDEVLNVFDVGPILVGPDLAFDFADFQEQSPTWVPSIGVQFSEPSTTMVLTVHLANNGIIEAGSFWLEFWGSRLGGLTLDDFLADSDPIIGGMPPLTRRVLTIEKAIKSVPDAPYTVTIVADRPNVVTEVYESNNRKPIARKRLVEVRPIRPINLRLPQFNFAPRPLRPGDVLRFNGSIVNDGTQHTGPFWVEFWGSLNQGMPTLGFLMCDSIYIPNLRPGQQIFLLPYVRTVYSTIPVNTEIAVMAVVDRPDHISELDESDNFQIQTRVQVLPPVPPPPPRP